MGGKTSIFKIKGKDIFIFGQISLILMLLLTPVVSSAALLDIEVLKDVKVVNSSETTTVNRWPTTVHEEPVLFTISGMGLADVSLNLVGRRKAMLVIPDELVGRVLPNGKATVKTNVTLDLSKVSVLIDTLEAVDQVIDFVNDIVNGVTSLVGISINLDEVNKQLSLLESVKKLGYAEFHSDLEVTEEGKIIYADIDKGLGPILADNVSEILTNLSKAVGALKVEIKIPILGEPLAAAVNAVLTPIKKLLATTTEVAVSALKPTGEGVQQLADAAVLGSTSILIPTLVSGPVDTEHDYSSEVIGTVVKNDIIDISLLVKSENRTMIYFGGERLDILDNLLPSSLNFGTHVIQTTKDELLLATKNGLSNAQPTTGQISLVESRRGNKGWSLKIRQADQWKNGEEELENSTLMLHLGELESTFSSELVTVSPKIIELSPTEQKEILKLHPTTELGSIDLFINRFELFTPKNVVKKNGIYKTTVIWTLTNEP